MGKWDEVNFGAMSFQNICNTFSDKKLNFPPEFAGRIYLTKKGEKFVAQTNTYKTLATSGWCREQIWFVLRGQCEITIGDEVYPLKKGDFLKLPTGNYGFNPIGSEPFEYVMVCELPEDFQKIEK